MAKFYEEDEVDVIWNGIRRRDTLQADALKVRDSLADAAKNYAWEEVFRIIDENEDLLNVARLGGGSLYAPLHQAAYSGASVLVAKRLIEMGAWRTLQNARGERPVDVADRQGHKHLLEVLTPVHKHQVPIGVLVKIQHNFHEVIRRRIDQTLPEHGLRLPELEPLLELDRPHMWFPVPGMYGGFSYWLDITGVEAKLISESWCRVVGGSGQRHAITSVGGELIEEGFV
jgi:hypothetical protein